MAGRAVTADNIGIPLPRAEVSEPTTGRSTLTDAAGLFELDGLPAGTDTQIDVVVPGTENYDSATVRLPTQAGQETNVNIAVLPVAVGTPTALLLSPSGTPPPNLEQGGILQFGASVYVGSAKIDVQPTWFLSGDGVGTISTTGLMTATSPGTGLVTVVAGGLTASTGVIVTGSRPPQISCVLVSASTDLPVPASGGPVMITTAISDGDGILNFNVGTQKGLKFEIYVPDGSVFELIPGTPVAGTIFDGTWRLVYSVPANSNTPGADGTQAPQTYSVRVAARDATGATAFSGFYDFTVLGLDTPPPPAP